jgi:hypothetical protein
MASEINKRDQNSVPVLSAITDDVNQEIRMLRVDPVTGRLKITGTVSTGTGYQQPLTGAVDGVNQTFTWATAPNILLVDGAVIQKVQQDGTINWTGGSTTILLVAPTFSLAAIS